MPNFRTGVTDIITEYLTLLIFCEVKKNTMIFRRAI